MSSRLNYIDLDKNKFDKVEYVLDIFNVQI